MMQVITPAAPGTPCLVLQGGELTFHGEFVEVNCYYGNNCLEGVDKIIVYTHTSMLIEVITKGAGIFCYRLENGVLSPA